ncbi:MAG: hypothetical protein AAF721_31800 [Myxococcota bacterium]
MTHRFTLPLACTFLILTACTESSNDTPSLAGSTDSDDAGESMATTATTATTASTASTGDAADSTGAPVDPFVELSACDETDFEPTPFIGPAFDPETGTLLEPLEPPFVVASTVGWARPEPEHLDALGMHSGLVSEDVFAHEGLLGASFGGSEVCGSARTITLWRDEAAMMGFVFGEAHAAAMTIVPASVRAWGATHWTETTATEPPTWETAASRIIADHTD